MEPEAASHSSPVDEDIAAIREQIRTLREQRDRLAFTLLSSRETAARLRRGRAPSSAQKQAQGDAIATVQKQLRRNTENVHRTLAGVTSFRVKDPDPYSVDEGRLLGVQIEVFLDGEEHVVAIINVADGTGSPITPYYLLLNRPWSGSSDLKIHKHTIPPAIRLSTLAKKYLPAHSASVVAAGAQSAQNLHKLVRELRKELTSYQLRLRAVRRLREEAGLPLSETLETGNHITDNLPQNQTNTKGKARRDGVSNLTCDADAREIRITWGTGLVARIKIGNDGKIEKVVVKDAEDGLRDLAMEKCILGDDSRIEGIVKRITARGVKH